MHTFQTIKQSNENYTKAIGRLSKRGFKELSLGSSGYSHYMGESYSCYADNFEEADEVSVSVDSLFEYGKPKHIEKTYWVYKSDFVKIKFVAHEKYNLVTKEYSYRENKPNKIKSENHPHTLRVSFGEQSSGIANLKDFSKRIKQIANKCKPHIKDTLLKTLKEAEAEILSWRKSRKELLTETL